MRRIAIALTVALLAGCGDLPHENPFDPLTPAGQQARTSLKGTVTLEPVGGVTPSLAGIVVSVAGRSHSGVTDATGAFVIEGVPSGTYTVQCVLTDYETTSIAGVTTSLDTAGGDVTVPTLAMRRVRATLTGQVDLRLPNTLLENTGGASVTLGSAAPLPSAGPGSALLAPAAAAVAGTTLTSADGSFAIDGVPAPIGGYTLTASKYGYLTQTTTVTFQGGAFVVQAVQLVIDPGAIVGSVLVVGAADSFGVTVRARGTTLGGTPWEQVTISDALGAYRISGLPAGTYNVSFELPDHVVRSTATSVAPGPDTVLPALELAPETGAVGGTVTATGAADHSGTVVEIAGGPDAATAATDTLGAWRVQGLRVGAGYTATYRRAGYATPVATSFAVTANATTQVPPASLAVATTAGVTGVARVERPATGADGGILVSLAGTDLNGAPVTGSGITAVDGSYTISGLPQGSYTLTFSKASYDPATQAGLVTLAGQATAAATVVLPVARGSVAGNILLSAGAAGGGFAVEADRSGTTLTLTEAGVAVAAPAVTDSLGRYTFTDVPAAVSGVPYLVTATRPYYAPSNDQVTPAGAGTYPAPDVTVAVSLATLSGEVALYDNLQHDLTANADSTGVQVRVTGTAFNGTAYAAIFATSTPAGGWTASNLPAGTFDAVATSDGRTCAAIAQAVVGPGAAASTSPVRCTDAIAPTAPTLGIPTGADGQPGFTRLGSIAVPVAAHGVDLVNFRGYQYVKGATPDWGAPSLVLDKPATITFTGLTPDATNVLWVRAIDWTDNVSPAVSVSVVQDGSAAALVTALDTPRPFVNATTTSVTLHGAEADANFWTYQRCSWSQGPTLACPSSCACPASGPCACAGLAGSGPGGVGAASCTLDGGAATPSAFALSLTANQRTCVLARAVDLAGNAGPVAVGTVTSDLTAPTGPIIAPLFDPLTITVHADSVDFRVSSAATDLPSGAGDWSQVAWVEVDTGGGFTPLCPAAACHDGGAYAPCSAACGCQDPRLVCNGTGFAAIRMPLNGGTANRFAVRAVDTAGNVGSGASQEVRTSGVMSAISTSRNDESAPRVRGRTLAYSVSGTGWVVDLGTNQRWDPGDATCPFGSVMYYPYAFAPLDSSTLVYTDGTSVKVRRAAPAGWCGAETEVVVGTRSGASWSIHEVAAAYDPATGRLERVTWAENDLAARTSQVWTLDAGSTGKIQAVGAPGQPAKVIVLSRASFLVTRLELGGDLLLVRGGNFTYIQSIDGQFEILHRPAGGWTPGAQVTFTPTGAKGAGLDSSGTLVAWVANDPWQTFHVSRAGLDGVFGTADDERAVKTWDPPHAGYLDVAVEAGHAVVTEYMFDGTGHLEHWTAGPNGRYGDGDDAFARILPTSAARQLPSLGNGLAGGLLYFNVSAGNNWDVFVADLSAFRWETLSDSWSVYPRPNRAGTIFFIRNDGVWARAPDGQETASHTWFSFFASEGPSLAGHVGQDVTLYQSDAAGRFFTATAPPPVKVLPGKAGAAYVGSSVDIAVGGGRIIVGACESAPGGYCNSHSAYILEPSPTLATPVQLRIDQPADGAPAGTSVPGYTELGISSLHAAWTCNRAAPASLYLAVCVREPRANGYQLAGDDTTLVLNRPGTATPYQGVGGLKLSGNRIAFSLGGQVHVVDAGPDGLFNTGDDTARDVGATSESQSPFIDLAGDYLAWMNANQAGGGMQAWLADLRNGTSRQVTDHYSSKYQVSVEPNGRVMWEDRIFSTSSIFTSTP